MGERIAMHELQRRAHHQRALARRLDQRRGLDDEKRAQPFAAAEAHMAHRLHQALRTRPLLGQRRRGEQLLKQALSVGRDPIEALPESRPGIHYVSHAGVLGNRSKFGVKISRSRVPRQAGTGILG